VAPTDQYDPQRLINYGANRWAFKPEFGYSRRLRHWVLDGHAGVWFYTRNPEFFSRNAYVPIVQVQTQEPIMALEGRVSYDVKPRLWVSLDANFWFGGRTSLNGVQNPATLQERYAAGKALREACPRDTHAVWKAPAGRPDPVQLVLKAEKGRLPELLPLHLLPGGGPHHGMRPRVHPGHGCPRPVLRGRPPVQLRRLRHPGVEGHLRHQRPRRNSPGPTWEWDVKRLAASFVVACRDNGLSDASARDVVMTCVRAYRESMAEFSQMKTLELWYFALGADELVAGIRDPDFRRRALMHLQAR